ncbi:hypothetical protein K488DRAFT_86497 [Vararia minispora EC-137]|uniref:Uncharacterized protein n=1 Tax=Vararia minispora EC-137 TaxID=1314806 RepID=A0ACB8QJF0_9AGAM|nr:hypothetical protein K488DRAFT_86497 [Vararia minispora EC-137]
MPHWSSPLILLQTSEIVVFSDHVNFGIILWEFLSFLKFDVGVLLKRRRLKLAFVLYLTCRLFPVLQTSLALYGLDIHNPTQKHISCKGLIVVTNVRDDYSSDHVLLSFRLQFSNLLGMFYDIILIRIATHANPIALWDTSRLVVAAAAIVILGSLGTSLRVIALVDAIPDPLPIFEGEGCYIINTKPIWATYTAFLVTEILTVSLTLSGLYRYKQRCNGTNALWKMLYHHGVFWVLLGIIVDVPTLVLLILDLNPALARLPNTIFTAAMDLFLVTPGLMTMYASSTDLRIHPNVQKPLQDGAGAIDYLGPIDVSAPHLLRPIVFFALGDTLVHGMSYLFPLLADPDTR